MFRILAAAFIAVVAACAGTPVPAHQAMSGWSYPVSCCSDRDCAEISAEAVREDVLDGYVVTVAPGSHPMWPATKPGPLVVAIPYLDSAHRRTVVSTSAWMRLGNLCFFAAIGGS